MTRRPALFLALLVYVALDLSLPAMPGAFVFEAADSVESVQGQRSRVDRGPAVQPGITREPNALRPPRADAVEVLRRSRPADRVRHPAVGWLPRRPDAPAPLSDDPH